MYDKILSTNFYVFCDRLLESIDTLVDSLDVSETQDPVVIAQDNFAIRVQAVDTMTFVGQDFTFNLGDADNTQITNRSIFEQNDNKRPTASLALPSTLFSSVNTTNNTRITNTVYTTDALFIRRQTRNREVGSIIVSASIPGVVVIGLDPPVAMNFSQRSVRQYFFIFFK